MSQPTRRPSHREIADEITDRIRRGEPGYRPGDQLPSGSQLAEQHGVSMSTISRAMGLLHDRGLVWGEPGRGVFVAG